MNILWLAPVGLINKDSIEKQPATWVISLAKNLVSRDIKLTIVTLNTEIEEDIIKLQYENIQFIYIKIPKLRVDIITFYFLKIKRVKKYLKEIINEYDILHIHGTEQQYEAMSDGLDIPKVVSIQGIMSEYIKFIPLID